MVSGERGDPLPPVEQLLGGIMAGKTNKTALYVVEETTWGTIPAGNAATLRTTGDSLKVDRNYIESGEIIQTRDTADVIPTDHSVSGGIDVEMSYGNVDALLAGMLGNNWTSDVLVNGIVEKSYSIERRMDDISGTTDRFFTFDGCRVDTFELAVEAGQIVTASFGLLGRRGQSTATTNLGTKNAATTGRILNATDDVDDIESESAALTGVLGFTLSLSNSHRILPAVGSTYPYEIAIGGFRAEGTIRKYFESEVLYDDFITGAGTNFEFTLTDGVNSYLFQLPAIRITDAAVPNQGRDGDLIAECSFTAYRDSVSGATLRITR